MKLNEAVSKRLQELLDEKNMTQYQLYVKSGVPKSTIGNIMHCSYDSVKLRKNYSISLFIENFLIHKSYNKYKRISFSVYYVTVKVNNSHSRLTLSHTMAHAEDRPPPWRFFIVF